MPAKPKPPQAGQKTSPSNYAGKSSTPSTPTSKAMPEISSNFKKGGKVKKMRKGGKC